MRKVKLVRTLIVLACAAWVLALVGCSMFENSGTALLRGVEQKMSEMKPTHGNVRISGTAASPLRITGFGGVRYEGGVEIENLTGEVSVSFDMLGSDYVIDKRDGGGGDE